MDKVYSILYVSDGDSASRQLQSPSNRLSRTGALCLFFNAVKSILDETDDEYTPEDVYPVRVTNMLLYEGMLEIARVSIRDG